MVEAEETVELPGRATDGDNGRAALAALLGHIVAYLSDRVDVNDLDIVSFSLHHLFCDFDALYRVLLPSFARSLAAETGEATDDHCGQLQPRTWMQALAVRQVVRRMSPLCQLLSEAGESILSHLGYEREDGGNEEDRASEAVSSHGTSADDRLVDGGARENGLEPLYGTDSEGIEQALHDLAATLMRWRQQYSDLPSFRSLLYILFPTVPLPLQPDTPFTQLLAYACTLFGDILPAFHALAPGDEEAVIMLLLDLLQQLDLLAMIGETLLQLFAVLLQ